MKIRIALGVLILSACVCAVIYGMSDAHKTAESVIPSEQRVLPEPLSQFGWTGTVSYDSRTYFFRGTQYWITGLAPRENVEQFCADQHLKLFECWEGHPELERAIKDGLNGEAFRFDCVDPHLVAVGQSKNLGYVLLFFCPQNGRLIIRSTAPEQ